jgi:hypothetical protein
MKPTKRAAAKLRKWSSILFAAKGFKSCPMAIELGDESIGFFKARGILSAAGEDERDQAKQGGGDK